MSGQAADSITRPERRGPMEGEATMGVDRPERRPGVPMDAEPSEAGGVVGRPLVLQEERRDRTLHRASLERPTPVFGTAQPHHGLSGALRSAAYRVPGHRVRHWMLILLADRVDVVEDRLGSALAMPFEAAGAEGAARRVRSRPLLALGVAVGTAWLARRLVR